jgi:hypothetical protein
LAVVVIGKARLAAAGRKRLHSYGVLFSTETARRVYSSRPRVCPHRIALRYCDGYRTRAMQLETA